MSEPPKPCIRGCARQCHCHECTEQPVHEAKPILAQSPSLLCGRDTEALWRWLSTVEDDTLKLSLRIPDDYTYDHGHTHRKVSGSPALIRLDVAKLIDPRSQPTVADKYAQYYDENQDEFGRSIPFQVSSWAAVFAEEQELKSPVGTMHEAVQVLSAWWTTLVAQMWIDEFYNDMEKIHKALNAAHGRRPPLPRGHCFTCGAQLWKEDGDGEDTITCPKCMRVYDPVGRVKLQLQQDREDRAGTIKG